MLDRGIKGCKLTKRPWKCGIEQVASLKIQYFRQYAIFKKNKVDVCFKPKTHKHSSSTNAKPHSLNLISLWNKSIYGEW
jgi:hypothetical protein